MNILHTKKFRKSFQKMKDGEKKKFEERLCIFVENVLDPILNNHPLHGKYQEYRSINITGDLRAVYKEINPDTFLFTAIGTHTELYE